MKRHTLLVVLNPPSQDFYGNRNRGSSAVASCTKPRHWIVAAATIGWLSMLASQPTEARDGQPLDGIAAHVNGEPITTGQLEEAVQSQIEQVNDQIEQIKRSMLDQLINNLLLRQAARAQGLDANDYLRVKVESLTVSEEEVNQAYAKSKHRFPRAFTGTDGSYEFKGLPGGRVAVIAHLPGKKPVKREQILPEPGVPGDVHVINFRID